MAAKEELNNHVIKINGPDTPTPAHSITEKQRRALKKKKKKKLKSIGKRHPEFELTYDMMLGIRYAVSLSEPSVTTTTRTLTRTVTATHTATATGTTNKSFAEHLSIYNQSSHKSSSPSSITESESFSDDDTEIYTEFLETKKYKFPSSGSETTPAHIMSDFKFKDYCPQIFRQLREWFRISTQEYLVTICGDFKLLEFISNSKSGQFFFFSHNSQFIIKTMTRTESIFLRKILPSYYNYISQQPDTLLPKFYGMHRVKRKKQKIYFLIQQNVFYSDVDDIHDQYDLKGSTQGRRATKAERKKGAILKDLDWCDEDKKLNIGRERGKLFKDQLKRDTLWLRTEKIMDYSLLVGVHYLNRAKKRNNNNNIPQIVVDHSNNNNDQVLYETPLRTVEENKEEIYDNKGDIIFEEEEEEEIIFEEEEIIDSPHLITSTTSHTGNEEEDIDDIDIDIDCKDEIEKKRRSSAPTIVSPKELMNVNSNNRYKFIENDNNRIHTKSQSLQLMGNLNLSPFNLKISQQTYSEKAPTKTTAYRGHISVKHPKRYKRKTAAEMQFPVDDIDIPVGIKHEVNEVQKDLLFEITKYHQQKEKLKEKKENEKKEEKAAIKDDYDMNVISLSSDVNNSNGDICPWTTFHGGMDSVKGNEVYFVGLIDILQKYNKRKKLENWIKKMKYDKNAISAAPPDLYAQRMCDFFEDKVV